MSGFLQEFKEFALRGNVVDLAVGLIIGAAFGAIVNSLVAAETMTGGDGYTLHALPHEELREILRKYNRLAG